MRPVLRPRGLTRPDLRLRRRGTMLRHRPRPEEADITAEEWIFQTLQASLAGFFGMRGMRIDSPVEVRYRPCQ